MFLIYLTNKSEIVSGRKDSINYLGHLFEDKISSYDQSFKVIFHKSIYSVFCLDFLFLHVTSKF